MHAVSVSGLKHNPADALRQARNSPVVVLNRDHPDAVLIALARVNGLGWLHSLFTQVVVSEVVLSEVLTGRYPDTETPIQQALAAGWRSVAASQRFC